MLLSAGDASLFTVGTYVKVAGFSIQSGGTQPTNHQVVEYIKILGISGSTISFATPLKYSYSQSWPLFFAGNGSEPDAGGPATLYVLDTSWDIDITYQNITFGHHANQQLDAKGRSVTLTNCTCTTTNGISPSQNQTMTWNNCDFSVCGIEVDKSVEIFSAGSGTRISQLSFQSASVGKFYSRGGLTIANSFGGTPRTIDVDSITVQGGSGGGLGLGPEAYGRADSASLTNSSFPSVNPLGGRISNISSLGITVDPINGLITLPLANAFPAWATIGGRLFLSRLTGGGHENEAVCTVLNVTTDGTNAYVSTTSMPSFISSAYYIGAHPCPSLVMGGSTGCADAIDLSQSNGKPFGEYSNRSYSGAASGTTLGLSSAPNLYVWGMFRKAVVTVSRAYTGIQSALTLSPFSSGVFIDGSGNDVSYSPSIDLKTAGTRTITPSGVAGSTGADSITAPGNIWFSKSHAPSTNHDVSGESSSLWPIVTIELFARQGFPDTAPLMLRLAS
jgi:hypothetical protein